MEKFYKTCMTCDARLTSDEKAIYMKLVNRTASEFLCLDCLSKNSDVNAQLWKNASVIIVKAETAYSFDKKTGLLTYA